MKKNHIVLLFLLFTMFMLAGCNVQTVAQYNEQKAEEMGIEQTDNGKAIEGSAKEVKADIKNNEEKNRTDQKKLTDSSKEKRTNENASTKLSEKSSTEKKTITKEKDTTSETKSNTKEKQLTTNQAPSKQKITANETKKETAHTSTQKEPKKKATVKEPKKKYVTIAIRVDTLLNPDHYKQLQPPLQNKKYVPLNGTVLKTTKYEILNEDDTVWQILLRATREHHIQLEYEGAGSNKYGSVYIEGINYLYEKDAGKLSGWMYSVNGVAPSVGCSSYKVKEGDQIVWQYTVDLGRDIGLNR